MTRSSYHAVFRWLKRVLSPNYDNPQLGELSDAALADLGLHRSELSSVTLPDLTRRRSGALEKKRPSGSPYSAQNL